MIRERLLRLWTSLQRPVSFFLTIVGVLATLYFGVKAPDWLEGRNAERARNMNRELIETVEDLILNNQGVAVSQITSQIRGKGLRYDVPYPYSLEDLIVQVQEDIMETVFLPLEKKVQLIETLESLKADIPPEVVKEGRRKAPIPWVLNVISALLATLAAAVAAIGVSALVAKHKKEREAEVSDRLETVKDEIADSIRGEVEYELLTESVLRGLGLRFDKSTGRFEEYDFKIESDTGPLFVECKYRPPCTLIYHPVVQQIVSTALMRHASYLLVTNATLTATASRMLDEHNAEHGECRIRLIRGSTEQELLENMKAALG